MAKRVRGRKKTKRGIWLIAIFVLFILYVVGDKSLSLAAERNKKEAQIYAIDKKIEEEEKRTNELSQKKAYIQTREYVEDVARQYLGLVYPDEIIIQPEQ